MLQPQNRRLGKFRVRNAQAKRAETICATGKKKTSPDVQKKRKPRITRGSGSGESRHLRGNLCQQFTNLEPRLEYTLSGLHLSNSNGPGDSRMIVAFHIMH